MQTRLIKRPIVGMAGWIIGASISSIIVLLLVAEILGLHNSISATLLLLSNRGAGMKQLASALLLAAVSWATIWMAVRTGKRANSYKASTFLWCVVGGGAILHLLLLLLVDTQWSTDYLRYWQYAKDLVDTGRYGGFNSPYYSRSLLVPYPIIRLFGSEATFVLKVVNVVLLTACQLFAYDILRRVSNHRAAQLATVLLVTAPIPAYATLIPSHDLWGMFFLSGSLWVLTLGLFPTTAAHPRALRWISLSILAGLVAYLAQLQRSIGEIFCVALVLSSIISWLAAWREKGIGPIKHTLLITSMASMLCLGSMAASKQIGDTIGLGVTGRTSLFMMKVAANSGGMGSGTSDWFVRFNDRFGSKQSSKAEAIDFARSVGLSSWALQPIDRTAHLANQARRLFELNYPMDWDVLLRRPKGMSSSTRETLILYADLYGVMFGGLFIYSLAILASFRRRPPFPVLASLLAVLLLALTLLLLFENKPFNIFPIWFAASLAIACAVAPGAIERSDRTEPTPVLSLRPIGEGAAFVGLAVFIACLVLHNIFGTANGRLINDWSFRNQQVKPVQSKNWEIALLDATPEAFDQASYDPLTIKKTIARHSVHDGERIQKYAGDAVVRLQFPGAVTQGDKLSIESQVCNTDGTRKNVEYFLFSPKGRDVGDAQFSLSASIDGHAFQRSKIPLAGRNFQRFVLKNALPDRACHTLAFHLEAVKLARVTAASRTPFVEIWMPRLVP